MAWNFVVILLVAAVGLVVLLFLASRSSVATILVAGVSTCLGVFSIFGFVSCFEPMDFQSKILWMTIYVCLFLVALGGVFFAIHNLHRRRS